MASTERFSTVEDGAPLIVMGALEKVRVFRYWVSQELQTCMLKILERPCKNEDEHDAIHPENILALTSSNQTGSSKNLEAPPFISDHQLEF